MPRGPGYVLTGVLLTGALVGFVFLARLVQPKPPALTGNFPRSQGPLTAPIQIIEYSDFQCAACQKAQASLSQLLGEHAGKIRLVFQHFPLDGHRWAPLAHQAAECSARQDRFWIYHDRLYAGQSDWSTSVETPIETFLRYGKEAGLDLERFASCLADPSVAQAIQEEKNAGSDLGVRSTPSFFVNGELVTGVQALAGEIQKRVESRE